MKNQSIIKNQRGQGLIEYLIIVALIAIAAIGMTRILGHNISIQFANITRALTNSGDKLATENVDRDDYSKKDLSNFMEGALTGESGGNKKSQLNPQAPSDAFEE